MEESATRRVAGYELGDELGRGGMGIVFAARHATLGRPAVLKRLRRELVDEPEIVERFLNEASTAAALHHPNVAAVYDCFRHRSEWYIAQEFVDGIDLGQLLERRGSLPPRIVVRVALQLARGLEALHAAGTIHRDLKPANVLISRKGEVKLVDFGIALGATREALTRPGTALGTPPYMSPEQLEGKRVDAQSDLFALGALMYEMLVGTPPYAAPADDEWAVHLSDMKKERFKGLPARVAALDEARGPRIPRELRRLVHSCLRARPARRAGSATALRRRLAAIGGRPSEEENAELAAWAWDVGVFQRREAETLVLATPVASPGRRRPSRLLAVALAGVALVGFWWAFTHAALGPHPWEVFNAIGLDFAQLDRDRAG